MFRAIRSLSLLVLAAAAGAGAPLHAATLTVGADFGCDFTSLQAAIDHAAATPGPDVIRVARNQRHVDDVTVVSVGDVRIVGGYSDCRDQRPLGITRVALAGDTAATLEHIRVEAPALILTATADRE